MRYIVKELVEDDFGLNYEETFSTNFQQGAVKVAEAMAACAKRDGYEYDIRVVDSYSGNNLRTFKNFS
jgi:hypothetical protein